MELNEFSDQFDTLLDSYRISEKFGNTENLYIVKLDEYEKSVLLTQSQESVISELYSGRNFMGKGYEQTEELRRALANLNVTKNIDTFDKPSEGISKNSILADIKDNVMYITHEQCFLKSDNKCLDNTSLEVIPIRRDEYNRKKRNPFIKNYIWRIDVDTSKVELIPNNFTVGSYQVTYLKKPSPIILEDLPEGVSINGVSKASPCELNEVLHKYVLEKAIKLALTYMASRNQNDENQR